MYTPHIPFAATSDYIITISQVLIFCSSSTVRAVQVLIVNDSVMELSKVFAASILLAEDSNIVKLMPIVLLYYSH